MTPVAIPADALDFVCAIVRDRAAIELESSKGYLIEARLAPVAKKHGFASPTEFIQRVRAKQIPELERRLVEAMTTNETSFYRDLHPFEALRQKILPEIASRNASTRTLSIWSAACSTGQELYSTAMLIREHFPDLFAWKPRLFGSDLSEEVLTRARSGSFSQIEVNRGLPANLLMKYFTRNGMQWQISTDLVAATTFARMNLIEPWPQLAKFDVIFLRNVLIYFAPDMKRKILQNVRTVMAPRAVLFLGAAETTLGLETTFEREQAGGSVYYRAR